MRDADDPTPALVLHAFITRAWEVLDYADWAAFCSDVIPFQAAGRGSPAGPTLRPMPPSPMLVPQGPLSRTTAGTSHGRLRPVRTVSGTFDVSVTPEPSLDEADGVVLARMTIDKRFHGPLDGVGCVHMTSARTPVAESAGYVAVEKIDGTLEGRRGSFVALHTGVMERGEQSLSITIVPDSGTGQLQGISGRMAVDIVDGRHHYTLTYEV